MFTRGCVEAIVSQLQPLDWLAADYVGFDDFLDIGLGDVPIPNGLRIDDDGRTVLALIETARLVGSHFAFETALRKFLFE
jgi:hypothetical protein